MGLPATACRGQEQVALRVGPTRSFIVLSDTKRVQNTGSAKRVRVAVSPR